jgi:hypothetical protein
LHASWLSSLPRPAFGKTTLLSEWVDNLRLDALPNGRSVGAHGRAPLQVAWLSLDKGALTCPAFCPTWSPLFKPLRAMWDKKRWLHSNLQERSTSKPF